MERRCCVCPSDPWARLFVWLVFSFWGKWMRQGAKTKQMWIASVEGTELRRACSLPHNFGEWLFLKVWISWIQPNDGAGGQTNTLIVYFIFLVRPVAVLQMKTAAKCLFCPILITCVFIYQDFFFVSSLNTKWWQTNLWVWIVSALPLVPQNILGLSLFPCSIPPGWKKQLAFVIFPDVTVEFAPGCTWPACINVKFAVLR